MPERLAEVIDGVEYPFHGTCDACSQGDRPLRSASEAYPDAWICVECVRHHERSIDVAADACVAAFPSSVVSREEFRDIAAVAVTAYNEFPGDE